MHWSGPALEAGESEAKPHAKKRPKHARHTDLSLADELTGKAPRQKRRRGNATVESKCESLSHQPVRWGIPSMVNWNNDSLLDLETPAAGHGLGTDRTLESDIRIDPAYAARPDAPEACTQLQPLIQVIQEHAQADGQSHSIAVEACGPVEAAVSHPWSAVSTLPDLNASVDINATDSQESAREHGEKGLLEACSSLNPDLSKQLLQEARPDDDLPSQVILTIKLQVSDS